MTVRPPQQAAPSQTRGTRTNLPRSRVAPKATGHQDEPSSKRMHTPAGFGSASGPGSALSCQRACFVPCDHQKPLLAAHRIVLFLHEPSPWMELCRRGLHAKGKVIVPKCARRHLPHVSRFQSSGQIRLGHVQTVHWLRLLA